jgi:D-cysteine desulfhydrase
MATGAFGSNHALATALHAPRAGLLPGALLFPQPESHAAWLNLRALVGTSARLEAVAHWSLLPFAMWRQWRTRGTYLMPPGGATPLGALGYVSAGLELGQQVAQGALPAPARLVVGVGSTCTSAGLLLGLALAARLGLGFTPSTLPRVISVRVSPWPVTSRFRILRLATRAARLLHQLGEGALPLFGQAELGARFEVDGRFLGPGYGEPSAAGDECEALWSELGLPALDGTYSAKAASRVVAALRANEPGPTLFWSTKSSVPLPKPVPEHAPPRVVAAWLERAERRFAP